MKRVVLLTLVALLAVSSVAAAQESRSYVLQAAGKWTGAHAQAVAAAGGSLRFSLEGTGIGVATSANPNFAATPISEGGAGAQVINMSLGAVFNKNLKGAGPLVAALNKAVNYADRFGVLVVSAAGNNGLDLDHSGNVISVPAQSGSGIAVSATGPLAFAYGATNFTRIASYTNFGTSAVNAAAPGGDFAYPTDETCSLPRANGSLVTTFCWVFDMVMSTVRGGTASTTPWADRQPVSELGPAAYGARSAHGHRQRPLLPHQHELVEFVGADQGGGAAERVRPPF